MRNADVFKWLFGFFSVMNGLLLCGGEKTDDAALVFAFDEGSGVVAKDGSGAGNDGSVRGATWVREKNGVALEFNGENARVETPADPRLDIKDGITVEAWIMAKSPQPPSPGKERRMGVVVYSNARARLWQAKYGDEDTVYFEIQNADGGWFRSPQVPIELDVWNHVAGVYDRELVKIYINGKLFQNPREPAKDRPLKGGLSKIEIGAHAFSKDRFFKGLIKGVRIYDRVLSRQEIENHFRGILGKIEGDPRREKNAAPTVKSAEVSGKAKGRNLLLNGSFETTTNAEADGYPGIPDAWNAYEHSPTVLFGADSETSWHGRKSAKICFSPSGGSQYAVLQCAQISLSPGQSYVFSVFLKSDTPGATVAFGSYGGKYGAENEIGDSWKRQSFVVRADAGVLRLNIKIKGQKGRVWVDAAQMEKGEVATSFEPPEFDPKTGGAGEKDIGGREIPVLQMVKTGEPPVVDGKLDDSCWKNAAVINRFVCVNGTSLPTQQTEAFLLYDDRNLYVGMVCHDSKIGELVLPAKDVRDGDLFHKDCVEIFIDPRHDHHSYFQFAVNPKGVQWDADENLDKAWNGNWRSGTSINEKSWVVEMAIPFSDLKVDPGENLTLGMNLNREYPRRNELSGWVPTFRGFHTPTRFGDLAGINLSRGRGAGTGNVTRIGEDQALMVNGKKKFPVVLWEVNDEFFLKDVAKNGMHMVHYSSFSYWPLGGAPDLRKLKKYLDKAESLGIKVLVDVRICFFKQRNRELRSKPDLDSLRQVIEAAREHPALYGWYLVDEPVGPKWQAAMAKVYEFVKRTDPNHVAMSIVAQPCWVNYIVDVVDVVMLDPYPIPRFPPSMVTDFVEEGKKCVEQKKPLWVVCQAFGGSEWFEREPTPDEASCMAYLAVVHGAKGVGFFSYKPMYIPLWERLGRVSGEFEELTSVILSPDIPREVSVSPSTLEVLQKKHMGRTYLIAVNPGNEPVNAEFKSGGRMGEIHVLFEKRGIPVEGKNSFRDGFRPFERHVYEIR
ncbi:MAG: sugar-binding protein [Verrucomicrobiae bacterium]|nr:sugar-binding protein [Verrucomicrobiae bacterium]